MSKLEPSKAVHWDSKVSALAAIYGPNAAGKSTLIDAFRYFRSVVMTSFSVEISKRDARVPFFLDLESFSEPSSFEIEFRIDGGDEYQYGFAANDEAIVNEYLYVFRTKRRTVLFERGMGEEPWYFGPSLKGPAAQLREATRVDSLFLSVAAAAKQEVLSAVYSWISNSLTIYAAHTYLKEHGSVAQRIASDDQYRAQILAFVANADLGVTNISSIESESREDIAEIAEAARNQAKERAYRLSLRHGVGNDAVDFPFAWESEGTKALISFASIALRALDRGAVCIVDEIDTSLHPLLVAELIGVFADPATNPKQAQLIFTTHDVSLLRSWSKSALEKDQVWLVDKTEEGVTELVSLIEYGRARPDENWARGYLTGRFGAVPTLAIASSLLDTLGQRESDDVEIKGEPR